jgi:hypothetical protein
MKYITLSLILIVIILGCTKDENRAYYLKLIETIPGGCAAGNLKSQKSAGIEKDTVTYSFSNGELQITVGFYATCCGSYNTSSVIENNTIFINIEAFQMGICNCICYYTYDFKYSGIFNHRGTPTSFNYHVNIDNHFFFNGLIKP